MCPRYSNYSNSIEISLVGGGCRGAVCFNFSIGITKTFFFFFFFHALTHCSTGAYILYTWCSSHKKPMETPAKPRGAQEIFSATPGLSQEGTSTTTNSTCRLSVLGWKILNSLLHGSSLASTFHQ